MILNKHRIISYLSFVVCIALFPLSIKSKPVYMPEEDIMKYPFLLGFKYNLGICTDVYQIHINKGPNSDGSYGHSYTIQNLNVHTFELNLDWIQISRELYKMMNGYPKLGVDFKYNRFENKGYIFSTLLHIVLQTDYLKFFEIMPKIGLGVAYLNLPLAYNKNIKKSRKDADGKIEYYEEEEPHTEYHDVYFRGGLSPELDIAIDFEFRVNENWLLKPSVGFTYIPDYSSLTEKKQGSTSNGADGSIDPEKLRRKYLSARDTDVIIYSAGLGLSYAINPSTTSYDDLAPEADRTYTKILISYGLKKYDRVAEFLWDSVLKDFSELANPSPGDGKQLATGQDGNYAKVNSATFDEYLASTRSKYSVFCLNLQWAKKFGDSHSLTFMTELIADLVNKKIMDNLGLMRNSSLKFSLGFGHDFIYGNFTFGQQIGFYIPNSAYTLKISSFCREIAFLRLSMDYKIKNHWLVGVAVKNRLEFLYHDGDLKVNNIQLSLKRFYKFDVKLSYPEIYIGYSL